MSCDKVLYAQRDARDQGLRALRVESDKTAYGQAVSGGDVLECLAVTRARQLTHSTASAVDHTKQKRWVGGTAGLTPLRPCHEPDFR